MHRLDTVGLEQRTSDKISRTVGQNIVGRTVNLVPHPGERTIGLETDDARNR